VEADACNTSVVAWVDRVFELAIDAGASDIHFEPLENQVRLRYRIDGVLYDRELIVREQGIQVVSRIKVLAHLDIAQRRMPQDGKFTIKVSDRVIDLRVSTFPTFFGEKVVIRILDCTRINSLLTHLGFTVDMLAQFKLLIERSSGFILVTGPTGSGKTTTLYAALKHMYSSEKNIITLEDPIEYSLEGITQGQIHADAGFSFAHGIRALLRQDPDIVMIGEMRDRESAHIAIEAAMTGHLVLSTMHTNDAPSAIMRLMDMGIEPFLINAALTGVLAQRLARLLCQHCIMSTEPTEKERILMHKYNMYPKNFFTASGCSVCENKGYSGRTGIFELFVMTENIRHLTIVDPRIDHIRSQACADGMALLMQDGLSKVNAGLISFSELLRSVF
jgi:type II secretory ATPase GspE/PulE/Tfp pilus assembly ATPase PilB-like protein